MEEVAEGDREVVSLWQTVGNVASPEAREAEWYGIKTR